MRTDHLGGGFQMRAGSDPEGRGGAGLSAFPAGSRGGGGWGGDTGGGLQTPPPSE